MDKVALVRLIRPTYKMDESRKETICGLSIYVRGTNLLGVLEVGKKRAAVKLLN